MPASTITLGPWPKGLNLTSNRDMSVFLEPSELGEATNVILTPEGFLQPRPGCKIVTGTALYSYPNTDFKILGSIKLPTGATCTFINAYSGGTSYVFKAFSPTNITLYFSATATKLNHALMYTGIAGHTGIMFFASEVNKSYVTTDYTLATAPTLISATNKVPGSDMGFIVKNRLFLVDAAESKFMWSPAINVLDWSLVDNPDTVGTDTAGHEYYEKTTPTDGIMAVEFVNNSFYIFKKYKTYMFTYQSVPADDAFSRKISDEFGAYDCTTYRGTVIVVNNRGIYRVDGTEFIDLQTNLNIRFEIAIDHSNITPRDIFITDFNDDIIWGYRDINTPYLSPDMYWNDVWSDIWETPYVYPKPGTTYYCMNGHTGGWTKWDYSYSSDAGEYIASPGSRYYLGQDVNTPDQVMFFTTFGGTHVVYMDWKPKYSVGGESDYNLDSNILNTAKIDKYYIPSVAIKTKANVGGSILKYSKIYRTFIRFYLSGQPTLETNPLWTASINYNDYRFSMDEGNDGNFLFQVYPTLPALPIKPTMPPNEPFNTDGYRRTYQLPIPQQRAVEFVFELKRKYSTTLTKLANPGADRAIQQGYYFLLSGVWFDYSDKAGI